MKVLICGLGSIGWRHLRHFRAAGAVEVNAYRTGLGTLKSFDDLSPDRVFGSLGDALRHGHDLVVVSGPTALHIPVAQAAADSGASVLVEKPVSDSLEGVAALVESLRRNHQRGWVAMNLRFHPVLRRLRQIVLEPRSLGAPISARIHFGSYLPAWHPWEDFRESYAARRELGGGAALTHVHEIDYCLWILGRATEAKGLAGMRHPLGTNVDECAGIMVRHSSGVISTLTLSLCQKKPSRQAVIEFENGSVTADLLAGSFNRETANEDPVREIFEIDFDRTYREQSETVLAAAAGAETDLPTIDEGAEALRVALTARES